MIKLLHNWLCFESQKRQYFRRIFRRKYFKNHYTGPRGLFFGKNTQKLRYAFYDCCFVKTETKILKLQYSGTFSLVISFVVGIHKMEYINSGFSFFKLPLYTLAGFDLTTHTLLHSPRWQGVTIPLTAPPGET
jgi:hypothetical protein